MAGTDGELSTKLKIFQNTERTTELLQEENCDHSKAATAETCGAAMLVPSKLANREADSCTVETVACNAALLARAATISVPAFLVIAITGMVVQEESPRLGVRSPHSSATLLYMITATAPPAAQFWALAQNCADPR